MAVVETGNRHETKENFILVEDNDAATSREERRRTGKYLAAGFAIFLLILGFNYALSHVITEYITKYAVLLGTALIMLLYLLWLLYASYRKNKQMTQLALAHLPVNTRLEENDDVSLNSEIIVIKQEEIPEVVVVVPKEKKYKKKSSVACSVHQHHHHDENYQDKNEEDNENNKNQFSKTRNQLVFCRTYSVA